MKPLVFSYRKYEELREAYKHVLADNGKLMSDNQKLREENTNLKIKLRIDNENKM